MPQSPFNSPGRCVDGKLVFTIGHSNHPMERLEELLRLHRITAVADVRSAPYSRRNPHFNREELARRLTGADIAYVFLGRELGGRSDDPADYENGRIRYDRLQVKPAFKAGVERVSRGALKQRIALLCSEKEPLDCHRTLLVAQALAGRGISVEHILADGSLEKHAEAMNRLLAMTGLKQGRLFSREPEDNEPTDDLATRAVALHAARVAHRTPVPPDNAPPRRIGR